MSIATLRPSVQVPEVLLDFHLDIVAREVVAKRFAVIVKFVGDAGQEGGITRPQPGVRFRLRCPVKMCAATRGLSQKMQASLRYLSLMDWDMVRRPRKRLSSCPAFPSLQRPSGGNAAGLCARRPAFDPGCRGFDGAIRSCNQPSHFRRNRQRRRSAVFRRHTEADGVATFLSMSVRFVSWSGAESCAKATPSPRTPASAWPNCCPACRTCRCHPASAMRTCSGS
jgi:hypothetical protein